MPQYYYCVYRSTTTNSTRFSQHAMPLRLIIELLLVATFKSSVVFRQKVYRINMCSFSYITPACVNEGDWQHQVTEYENEALTKMKISRGDGWDKKDGEQICSQPISYKWTSRALTCSKSYREHPEAPDRTVPTLVKPFRELFIRDLNTLMSAR
jgi:hypothetical protein